MSSTGESRVVEWAGRAGRPVLLRGRGRGPGLPHWPLERWGQEFGAAPLPFRCGARGAGAGAGEEPRWDRRCSTERLTFDEFMSRARDPGDTWMYFDYKHMAHWLPRDSALHQEISWASFGFPGKGAADSTLWIGSEGAHTPAHRDTYGTNIVVQLHGKKRWILYPPETGSMKPTRVPYEESSIYSEINFYLPRDMEVFKDLRGCRSIELEAGDALIVPNGWWHYVENTSTIGISLNMWFPHENDSSAQVSEALIRILVAQICKDLPLDTAKLLLNPNEDDLPDTPLSVLFLQLDKVAKAHIDKQRKLRRIKRQRTREDDPPPSDADTAPSVDVNALIENKANNLEYVPPVSSEELVKILRGDKDYSDVKKDEDEADGITSKLCLTKAVINAYCAESTIESVKENLLASLRCD